MFNYLLNLFYPKTCLGCDGILQSNQKILCSTCRHELPLTHYHLKMHNDAYKRLQGRVPVEFMSSMLYYTKDGIVQNLVHKLKYEKHQEVGVFLGEWYAQDIKEYLKNVDEIIPVPLHPKRLKERGYNQVKTFCEALSETLHIPINETLLLRQKYGITQTKKTLELRTSIQKDVFEVVFTEADFGKHFLLVDDVLTSGTTLEQCCRALLKIPNAQISIVTIAITQ